MFNTYQESSQNAAHPHNVYPSCLFCLGLGYALWHPEPHETGEPRIGDIGYVSRGAFIRVHNIDSSKSDNAVTFWKPPCEPEEPSPEGGFRIDGRTAPIAPDRYRSRGVYHRETGGSASVSAISNVAASISASYTCKETHGALLVLQSEAREECIFDNLDVKDYMLRQHAVWHAYVRDVLRQGTLPEDIFLVSGSTKTSADWAAMAFGSSRAGTHMSVSGQTSGFFSLDLFRTRSRVVSGPKIHRHGSLYPRSEGTALVPLKKDQTIFVRRWRMKRRLILPDKIVAGAGHDRLPDSEDKERGPRDDLVASQQAETRVQQAGVLMVVDPLDTLLDYIFEVSGATMAFVRDEDVTGIVGADMYPVDLSTYLRKVQPPVDVTDGCGMISLTGLLEKERLRYPQRQFIKASDLVKWPQSMPKDHGRLEMSRLRLSFDPGEKSRTRPWPHLAFSDLSSGALTDVWAVSKDGALLASTSNLCISVWTLSNGLSVQRITDYSAASISALAFSPDGRQLAGATDEAVMIWDVVSAELLLCLEGHSEPVNAVAYSPNGSYIASGGSDATVKIWNASSGAPLASYSLNDPVLRVFFSEDGSKLAAQTASEVAVFSADAPFVQLAVIPSRNDFVCSFTPSGDRIIVNHGPRTAYIYDTQTFKAVVKLDKHNKDMSSAAFSSDGRRVAIASQDTFILLQSTWPDGTKLRRVSMETTVMAVAFSPDGALLAGIDHGGMIRVWIASSVQFVAEFRGPNNKVRERPAIQFLPDSRRIITCRGPGAVRVWDVGDVFRLR